jgi:hypothetical protein
MYLSGRFVHLMSHLRQKIRLIVKRKAINMKQLSKTLRLLKK